MAAYDWPTDLVPFRMEFRIQPHVGGSESPFTRQGKYYELSAPMWVARMTFRGGDGDRWGTAPVAEYGPRLDALVAKLKGRRHRVRLWDFRREGESGPVNAAIAAGDTEVTLTSGTVAVGRYVGGDGRPHLVIDVEGSVLTVEPPFRSEVGAGEATFERVSGYFRLVSDDAGANFTEVGQLSHYDLSFAEDLAPPSNDDLDPSYVLALDFSGDQGYRLGSGFWTSVDHISGYTYTRTGTEVEFGATEGLESFAANVPAVVDGVGYWSRVAHTNTVTHSQALDNAAWTPNNVTVGAGTGGTLTDFPAADVLNEGTSNSVHSIASVAGVSFVDGTKYTKWVIAKAGTASIIQIPFGATPFGSDAWADFDLVNGTHFAAPDCTAGMYEIASGVWLCWATAECVTNGTGSGISIAICQTLGASRFPSYLGTSRTVQIFHAQALEGSDLGPVIVTAAAEVTVGATKLVLDAPITSDDDFAFWATGTYSHAIDAANEYLATLSNGTTGNIIALGRTVDVTLGSEPGYAVAKVFATTVQHEWPAGDAAVSGEITVMVLRRAGKFMTLYKASDGFVFVEPETLATTAFPTIDRLEIGFAGGSSSNMPDAPIDSVFLRRGTFTDDEAVELLGGYTGTHRFEFVSRSPNVGAHQGVAFDGTHYYTTAGGVTAQFTLSKYDEDWTLIDTLVIDQTESGVLHEQINGLYVDGSTLLVCANNYNTAPNLGWVFEVDIATFTFTTAHQLPGNRWTEAIEKWNGYWWEVNASAHEIRQISLDFTTLVDTHVLPDDDPGLLYYQSIVRTADGRWFLNHHDEIDRRLRCYTFDGADFQTDPGTYHPPSTWCTQHMFAHPNGIHMLWAERISGLSGALGDDRVVTTTI